MTTNEDLLKEVRKTHEEMKNVREVIKATHDEIKASEKRVLAKVGIKLAETELRMDDRARNYNNTVLNRFDTWAGELENAKQDRTISTQQIGEIQDDLTIHDNRIKALEKIQHHS